MSDVQQSDRPYNRLTRMCDDMTKVFDAHPEHLETDKCIVFLDDATMAGLVIHGYEDQKEAIADLFLHLKAMFAANGMSLDLMTLNEDGVFRG